MGRVSLAHKGVERTPEEKQGFEREKKKKGKGKEGLEKENGEERKMCSR